jgi:hypothetical protein
MGGGSSEGHGSSQGNGRGPEGVRGGKDRGREGSMQEVSLRQCRVGPRGPKERHSVPNRSETRLCVVHSSRKGVSEPPRPSCMCTRRPSLSSAHHIEELVQHTSMFLHVPAKHFPVARHLSFPLQLALSNVAHAKP